MQLAAYGAQDIYLTGNPQITFLIVLEDILISQLNVLTRLLMEILQQMLQQQQQLF